MRQNDTKYNFCSVGRVLPGLQGFGAYCAPLRPAVGGLKGLQGALPEGPRDSPGAFTGLHDHGVLARVTLLNYWAVPYETGEGYGARLAPE